MIKDIVDFYYDHADDTKIHTFENCYVSFKMCNDKIFCCPIVIDGKNRKIVDLSAISINPRVINNISDKEILDNYNNMINNIDKNNFEYIDCELFYGLTMLPIYITHLYLDVLNLLRKYINNNLKCKILTFNINNKNYNDYFQFILNKYINKESIKINESNVYKIKILHITQSAHNYQIIESMLSFKENIDKIVDIDTNMPKRTSVIKIRSKNNFNSHTGYNINTGIVKEILDKFNFKIINMYDELYKIKRLISSDIIITSWGGSHFINKYIISYRNKKLIVLCDPSYIHEWCYLCNKTNNTKFNNVIDDYEFNINIRYIFGLDDNLRKDIDKIIYDFI